MSDSSIHMMNENCPNELIDARRRSSLGHGVACRPNLRSSRRGIRRFSTYRSATGGTILDSPAGVADMRPASPASPSRCPTTTHNGVSRGLLPKADTMACTSRVADRGSPCREPRRSLFAKDQDLLLCKHPGSIAPVLRHWER